MKSKLLKFVLVTPFALTPFAGFTSCSIVKDFENRPRQIDGSDWVGLQSGLMSEDTYHFNHNKKEIVYWNFSQVKTKDLVIPDYIMYNGQKYAVKLDPQAFYHCYENIEGTVELNSFTDVVPEQCFDTVQKLTRVIFRKRPKKIADNAFYHCINLQEIKYRNADGDLSDSWALELESIGKSAFEDAPVSSQGGLHDTKEILFGPSLKSIGECAFAGNDMLNRVILSPATELPEISNKAFYACSALQEVYLAKQTNIIRQAAFSECQNLKFVSFNLDTAETEIQVTLEKEAFSHCDSLVSFIKGDNPSAQIDVKFTAVGESCFCYDPKLDISQFYRNLKDLPASIFEGCNASKWVLDYQGGTPVPATIGKYALALNKNLAIIDMSSFYYASGHLDVPEKWNPTEPQYAFISCAEWGKISVHSGFKDDSPYVENWIDWFAKQGIEINKGDPFNPNLGTWFFEEKQ